MRWEELDGGLNYAVGEEISAGASVSPDRIVKQGRAPDWRELKTIHIQDTVHTKLSCREEYFCNIGEFSKRPVPSF